MRSGWLLVLALATAAAAADTRGRRLALTGNEVDAEPFPRADAVDAGDALAQALALLNSERPCAPCSTPPAGNPLAPGAAGRGGRRRGSDSSDSSDSSDDSSDSSDSNGGDRGQRTLITLSCPSVRPDWCTSGTLTTCNCCPTCLVYLDAGASCGHLGGATNARCRPPTLCIDNSCVYGP